MRTETPWPGPHRDWQAQLSQVSDEQLRRLLDRQLTADYRRAVWDEIKRRRILP